MTCPGDIIKEDGNFMLIISMSRTFIPGTWKFTCLLILKTCSKIVERAVISEYDQFIWPNGKQVHKVTT